LARRKQLVAAVLPAVGLVLAAYVFWREGVAHQEHGHAARGDGHEAGHKPGVGPALEGQASGSRPVGGVPHEPGPPGTLSAAAQPAVQDRRVLHVLDLQTRTPIVAAKVHREVHHQGPTPEILPERGELSAPVLTDESGSVRLDGPLRAWVVAKGYAWQRVGLPSDPGAGSLEVLLEPGGEVEVLVEGWGECEGARLEIRGAQLVLDGDAVQPGRDGVVSVTGIPVGSYAVQVIHGAEGPVLDGQAVEVAAARTASVRLRVQPCRVGLTTARIAVERPPEWGQGPAMLTWSGIDDSNSHVRTDARLPGSDALESQPVELPTGLYSVNLKIHGLDVNVRRNVQLGVGLAPIRLPPLLTIQLGVLNDKGSPLAAPFKASWFCVLPDETFIWGGYTTIGTGDRMPFALEVPTGDLRVSVLADSVLPRAYPLGLVRRNASYEVRVERAGGIALELILAGKPLSDVRTTISVQRAARDPGAQPDDDDAGRGGDLDVLTDGKIVRYGGLAEGLYDVLVDADGMKPVTLERVSVARGEMTPVRVMIESKAAR
jgi:hypothetical protein